MHINPDHFLETPNGRVVTPERNAAAWQRCFEALENALSTSHHGTLVFLLVGAQGSGKTTLAERLIEKYQSSIVFDAILVKRQERIRIIQSVNRYTTKAIAVVLDTPLVECIARNASRAPDQIVSEQAIRNVYAAIELPTKEEGFHKVFTATEMESLIYEQ